MADATHSYKHGTEINSQEWFWEECLHSNEQFSVWKDNGKYKELQRS